MTLALRDNPRQLSYRKKNPRLIFESNSNRLLKNFTALFNQFQYTENTTGDRVLDQLPVDLRNKVLNQLERDYTDFNIQPGTSAWRRRKNDYINALQTYFDARFQVKTGNKSYRFKNKEWSKIYIKDALRSSLSYGGNPKKLAHIVRCTIDINGLKSINDLSSKVKGDEFLNHVTYKLYDLVKNTIVSQYGKKTMRFALVSEGGDELTVYIELTRPVKDQDITFMYQTISQGLCFDCSQYLPNHAIERRGGVFIPASLNYNFYASAGVSVESLESLLVNKRTYSEVKRIIETYEEKNSPCDIESILVSAILNRADELTEKDKELYKHKLARSKNPNDAITYQVLMRNKEMIRLYRENQQLARQLEQIKDDLESQKTQPHSLLNDLASLLSGNHRTHIMFRKKIIRS